MSTHYVPAFTVINGRSQQAACGVWVRAGEHTTEPTCSECQAWLSGRERDDNPFEVDTNDPLMQPVKPSFGANADAQAGDGRERHR